MISDNHYSMFEKYFNKAAELESSGRIGEARQMYLMASDECLRAAKGRIGSEKASLVSKADKLTKIADALEKVLLGNGSSYAGGKSFGGKSENTGKGQGGNASAKGGRPEDKILKNNGSGASSSLRASDDENATVWRSSGKPNVHFYDIAGLEDVKESIDKRIIQPRLHPEVYAEFGVKLAGGILLYGPPGTGKTMMAKAIATEVDAEFFSIRCSDIVGKYFGEAEKNVKGLFEAARSCEQAVIFFDEFEALAAKRGGNSTVMNRLVPELLSQMDGFQTSDKNNVLVLAATNRPWDIDSAFMRPPRLTEKIYVGLPDFDARYFLIKKAFANAPGGDLMDLHSLTERTEGFNAADIIALCNVIKYAPIDRSIKEGITSPISEADVEEALAKFHSSVQKSDIEKIRNWESQTNK